MMRSNDATRADAWRGDDPPPTKAFCFFRALHLSLAALAAAAVLAACARSDGPAPKADAAAAATAASAEAPPPGPASARTWAQAPVLDFKGGLKVFWNVGGETGQRQEKRAVEHGFSRLTLWFPTEDYCGTPRGSEHILRVRSERNPWAKPDYFERSLRRSIAYKESSGVYINDFEFWFSAPEVAWTDPAAREASGARDFAAFRRAYVREAASWYAVPSRMVREAYPGTAVGIYGVQPFQADYWDIYRMSRAELDESQRNTVDIWRYVEPYIDVYTPSVYVHYDEPGSVFYIAADVEETFLRTRIYGDKPVYAYTWLRFHESNRELSQQEIQSDYLVDAMAIVPFFSGGSGVVLWGDETKDILRDELIYSNLGRYMAALNRVAALSEELGRARLVIDEPARELWKAERPLVRRLVVAADHCIVMAMNPWQGRSATTQANVLCGDRGYSIPMEGKAITLARIESGRVTRY